MTPHALPRLAGVLLMAAAATGAAAQSQSTASTVYRCPGPPVLYTDALSPEEARDKGCRTIEGAPITIMQSARPRPAAPASAVAAAPNAAQPPVLRPPETRIDPNEQRARDSDRRGILESELRKEEERLSALLKDFNNGEPERRGDERNFARYQERVAEMKATISRKESDIAAIKRELAKLPN